MSDKTTPESPSDERRLRALLACAGNFDVPLDDLIDVNAGGHFETSPAQQARQHQNCERVEAALYACVEKKSEDSQSQARQEVRQFQAKWLLQHPEAEEGRT